MAVRFESVSFSYGNALTNKHQVLECASFHIHKGEFVAMIGPNGSGKTTVLKLLFGLEKPCSGIISLSGTTAYVSQQMPIDNMFPITVRDIVRMGLLQPYKSYSRLGSQVNNSIEEALENTGITELTNRQYHSLSGGQKRRVLVARALVAMPQLLILDEPTANMDMESEKKLYETLEKYKGKTTILIVTHDTEFVTSLTDRVLCLGDGLKIVQHRTETQVSEYHGGAKKDVRVLHGENISCC